MNKIILSIILVSSLLACKENKERHASPLLGQKLQFPDTIFIANNDKIEKTKANYYSNYFKLIISYSGECPSCVKSIKKWKEIINPLKNNKQIRIFFIMDISNKRFFMNNIYPLLPKNELYILNYEYNFQKINNLQVPEIRTHGIILDKNNKVIYDSYALIGNKPSYEYTEEIDQILN
ncbi:MAG: hypothetical protein L3J74_18565 [Bacteroidales bacterium]|nr:hypothetical protein [Bacteroidales bacterium]